MMMSDGFELAPRRGLGRYKLGQGFSQMDWVRLCDQSTKLGGTDGGPRGYTMKEVNEHNNMTSDAWMVLKGKVYDVTKYGPYHPGGLEELVRGIGADGTALFEEYHPWVSESIIEKCEVGWLIPDGADATKRPPPMKGGQGSIFARFSGGRGGGRGGAQTLTHGVGWMQCHLVHKMPLEHAKHCLLVRLEVIDREMINLLRRPGAYVKLRKVIGGKMIERPFTPFLVGPNEDTFMTHDTRKSDTEIDLLVKVYKDGLMTQFLLKANEGTELELQICKASYSLSKNDGKIELHPYGSLGFRKLSGGGFRHICMIAAGTGIMPILQMLEFLDANYDESIQVSLIFASKNDSEILFEQELDKLVASTESCLVKVTHVLSTKAQGEKHRIDNQDIMTHLQSTYGVQPLDEDFKQPKIRFMICGSFQFNIAVEQLVAKLGWPSSGIIRID